MKSRLLTLFHSSRPLSWVNTAYPFAAGYLLTTGSIDWVLIVGSLYFLIPYNLLMYGINDVFDYESDLQNPRKGGVEGAKLAKPLHGFVIKAAILSNLPFLALLLYAGSWQAGLALAAVVFMVVAYSAPQFRFKEIPFLDSITSSAHFTGPLVYALALTGWHPAFWPYVVAFFLWGMASHAFGAVQDVVADRAAGIGSIATVIGARNTVWFSAILYAACASLLANQPTVAVYVAPFILLYILNVLPYGRITDGTAPSANAGWRRFLWLNYLTGAAVTIVLILAVI